jgi:hypothetical protein
MSDDIASGERRWVVWDRKIWWRYYREGGFDGYRTLFPPHQKLACGALAQRVARDTASPQKRKD